MDEPESHTAGTYTVLLPCCFDRVKLANAVDGTSSALNRILQLELRYLATGDLVKFHELEGIAAETMEYSTAAAAAYKQHVEGHVCEALRWSALK